MRPGYRLGKYPRKGSAKAPTRVQETNNTSARRENTNVAGTT
jgi:hypothetical protein